MDFLWIYRPTPNKDIPMELTHSPNEYIQVWKEFVNTNISSQGLIEIFEQQICSPHKDLICQRKIVTTQKHNSNNYVITTKHQLTAEMIQT